MKPIKIIFVLLFSTSFIYAQEPNSNLPIIPFPAELNISNGNFQLTSKTEIVFLEPDFARTEVEFLANYLNSNFGLKIKSSHKIPKKENCIIIRKSGPFEYNNENYQLKIDINNISIVSGTSAGVFYGIQSLIQLIPIGQKEDIQIQCLNINDYPRYQWRGMHLDCSRHFFSTDFIKKYIDCLALYKMNVFHWHLTDDQGWRIEIKKYPKLTEVGAWRKGSMVGPYSDNKFDSIRYGGFYSQKEIKEIVAYAQKLHVTIVPEIEMPGHALAALAAYPQYSCSGQPSEVGMKWGVETNVFCPTEETFTFLDNILTEVAELFPGKYIHIGGDEVLKDEWEKSVFCIDLMKKQNLKDAHELQSYFIKRIELMVNSKGKMIIGWDEILEGGLAPNAAVMSWRGTDGGVAAAKQKHYVVMTPGSHCYFDHYQGNKESEPLAIGGFTPLEKVYAYEPTPDTLNLEEAKYILGAQANVWTEYITSSDQVEYMALPRMAALAEVVWSKKESKNYEQFYQRLLQNCKLLDLKNIHYSRTALKK